MDKELDLQAIKEFGIQYLSDILNHMGIDDHSIDCQVSSNADLNFTIDTHKNALIIGRDGRTLSAFTTLLRHAVEVQFSVKKPHISIDAGGYLEHQLNDLKIIALNAAKKVLESKKDFRLKPMNSYERHFIHEKLSNYEGLTTESTGTGASRAVVVKYCGEK